MSRQVPREAHLGLYLTAMEISVPVVLGGAGEGLNTVSKVWF